MSKCSLQHALGVETFGLRTGGVMTRPSVRTRFKTHHRRGRGASVPSATPCPPRPPWWRACVLKPAPMLCVVVAVLLSAVVGAQQGSIYRQPTPANTWMNWPAGVAEPTVVVIRAGRLFDSKTGQVLTRQVIVADGERIAEVGPEGKVTIPAGSRQIDLSQAIVMPGFIDAHSHVFESAPDPKKGQTILTVAFEAAAAAEDSLLAGFTTMRDAGSHGNGNADVAVRDAINRGEIVGPRLSVST